MKNLFLLCSLAAAVTGCRTQKRSTASPPAEAATPRSRSPRFIDHIAINPGNNNNASPSKVVPSYASSTTVSAETENLGALQLKYAILLDVPAEQLTDARILEFIDSWYGTRYKYGGSDRSGVDCSGFVQAFISAIYGITLPRTSLEQYHQSRRIHRDDLREGDLVFFHTIKRTVSHVGVYLRNNKFVHASTSGGVVVSSLEEEYYARRLAGCGRVQ